MINFHCKDRICIFKLYTKSDFFRVNESYTYRIKTKQNEKNFSPTIYISISCGM
ncbi:hypothetical protein T190607A01A_20690 [Tenacibaculum sp. 190524A05c]|uniref:Uncharacterized protein n=1 Tax=Tenacibaculum platacis TaxID=3137852 RepID=A0ABP1EQA9_9FLAO